MGLQKKMVRAGTISTKVKEISMDKLESKNDIFNETTHRAKK